MSKSTGIYDLEDVIEKLKGPHADKIYVAKDYSIADLIQDLTEIDLANDESWDWAQFHAERGE